MQNETAKLTERWGVQIVICANAETLLHGYEIDVCDETVEQIADEMATAAVSVLENKGIFAWNESSAYEDWHGGRYGGQWPVHVQWMTRGLAVPADEIDAPLTWEDLDHLCCEWSPANAKCVPHLLWSAMEAIRYRMVEAMGSVARKAEAREEARADG
jgi:hypothetical protein